MSAEKSQLNLKRISCCFSYTNRVNFKLLHFTYRDKALNDIHFMNGTTCGMDLRINASKIIKKFNSPAAAIMFVLKSTHLCQTAAKLTQLR